jgi:AraC family transcriptional regulator of adaptative response/methylated-DNA-[protein]-cysteine methyltransferase
MTAGALETETAARYWRAVVEREAEMDGVVWYAVRTTGVYCRPSCGARRPRRENVLFFERRGEAESAGFRPCRRCRPEEARPDPAAQMVRAACRYMEAHSEGPVTLAGLARALGFSPFHIQRTFKAVLGVSPRAWAEGRRLGRFKQGLRAGTPVTRALYDAGYGSSSRLYEKGAAQLGMTPAAYGKGGAGAEIDFAVTRSAQGNLLVAATRRGVCAVRWGGSRRDLERELRAEFPNAVIRADGEVAARYALEIARLASGEGHAADVPLEIRATAFQRRVWEELLRIPRGETRSYAEVAAASGNPRAVRAVARACAANPVALAIPCHRVVRSDGQAGGYRWGAERKRALLEAETKT